MMLAHAHHRRKPRPLALFAQYQFIEAAAVLNSWYFLLIRDQNNAMRCRQVQYGDRRLRDPLRRHRAATTVEAA